MQCVFNQSFTRHFSSGILSTLYSSVAQIYAWTVLWSNGLLTEVTKEMEVNNFVNLSNKPLMRKLTTSINGLMSTSGPTMVVKKSFIVSVEVKNTAFHVYVNNAHKAGVGNLWLASQMWLFWWRHLAHLTFLNTQLLLMKLFCYFPSTRLQSHQQRHAAPDVALKIISMLLKIKFIHLPLFKIVGLLKNAQVR